MAKEERKREAIEGSGTREVLPESTEMLWVSARDPPMADQVKSGFVKAWLPKSSSKAEGTPEASCGKATPERSKTKSPERMTLENTEERSNMYVGANREEFS